MKNFNWNGRGVLKSLLFGVCLILAGTVVGCNQPAGSDSSGADNEKSKVSEGTSPSGSGTKPASGTEDKGSGKR